MLEISPYVTDAYNLFKVSNNIKGKIIQSSEDEIKVETDKEVLQIKLKQGIKAKEGDTVLIDKKNIEKIKSIRKEEIIDEKDKDKYETVLKLLDVQINEQTLKAAKILDLNDIKLTKENINSFVISKEYLDKISINLDYDTALKVIQKDIDIENESLHKIALAIDEVKNEKEGFSFFKIFKKKEISTDEASHIAKQIYGSPMGKDITDIIKALYKANVSITKKTIEKINDTFYKLDKLKDIDTSTLVDVVKNNLEATIDNIYKIKNYIRKSEIKSQNTGIYISKLYQQNTPYNKVTDKQLKLLEEDIKDLLKDIDIKVNNENISLCKEFIKNDLEINSYNIQRIYQMKDSLKELIKTLDLEKAAILVKKEIDIEKEDITKLVEEIKSIKDEEKIEDIHKEQAKEILEKINSLEKITEKELIQLIKRNIDFKLDKLKLDIKLDTLKIEDKELKIEEKNEINLKAQTQRIIEVKNTLEKLKELDLTTIAFQVKNKLPMTLKRLEKTVDEIKQTNSIRELTEKEKNYLEKYETNTKDKKQMVDSIKALMKNNINVDRGNIEKVQREYEHFRNIKENITAKMVIQNKEDVREIELEKLSKYVDSYKIKTYEKEQTIKNYTQLETLKPQEKENIISLLMKNEVPLVLKNIKNASMLIKNKNQIGHIIGDITTILKDEKQEIATKLENLGKKITEKIKKSQIDIQNIKEEIEKEINNINNYNLDSENKNLIKEKINQLKEVIQFENIISKQDDFIQLPVYINNTFTNLQIYIKQKNKNKLMKKEEISIAFNIDTKTIGNLNVYMDIYKKNINLKIGAENETYKTYIKNNKDNVKTIFEGLGYNISNITFYVRDNETIIKDEEKQINTSTGFLDIKI